jgi:hypothetical protein
MVAVDFGLWFSVVITLLHLGFCTGVFLGYLGRPFISDWMNKVCLAVCVHDVLLGVSGLIAHLAAEAPGLPVFVLAFVLLPISGVVVYIVNRLETKALKARFARNFDPSGMSDAELVAKFEELRIGTSERNALLSLNYAVATHNLTFYSFQFMKFVISKVRNAHVLTYCARLMSWLPSCGWSLSALFGEAIARRDLDLEQRFILFQLERVRLLRESSSLSGAAGTLETVKAASAETVLMMLAFWERTVCSIGLLNAFARERSDTESL